MGASLTRNDPWSQAVDLGVRGRYLPAWHRLAMIDDRDPMASLAHSTCGSHYRQIGQLDLARRHDDMAVELAVNDLQLADAWIGIAADAIAGGFVAEAAEHLGLVEEVVDRLGDRLGGRACADADADEASASASGAHSLLQPWRAHVRAAWVHAEAALLRGDAAAAVDHARVAIASSTPHSARHHLKSQAILAAGLLGSGGAVEAVEICERLGTRARRYGWVSLMWPLALIAMAAERVDPQVVVSAPLVFHGAWATRLIEAHLPDGPSGEFASRWRERPDIASLRALAGR